MSFHPPNSYERLVERDCSMYVRSDRRALLQRNGLVHFEDFVQSDAGELVNAHPSRQVFRLELRGEDSALAVFLKRSGPIEGKEALFDLLKFRRVRTKATREFAMLCAFREGGLTVPEVLACGERHVLGRDRASLLVVEALPSGRALGDVLAEHGPTDGRKKLLHALARFVRALHDGGFTHADLFAKHVFASQAENGDWSFAVIDLQRARHSRVVSPAHRARDLAALMVSVHPDATSLGERLRFLREYLGKTKLEPGDRHFLKKVLSRARKLSRRTVYRAWQPVLEGV